MHVNGKARRGRGRPPDPYLKEAIDVAQDLQEEDSTLKGRRLYARVKKAVPLLKSNEDAFRVALASAPPREMATNGFTPIKRSEWCVTARVSAHERGIRPRAPTPIGYLRIVRSPTGREIPLRFNENFQLPTGWWEKGWTEEFKIDPMDGPIIKFIFESIADVGLPFRIAEEANRRGLRGRRRPMSDTTIKRIVRGKAYKGITTTGEKSKGKFYRVSESIGPSGKHPAPHDDIMPAIVTPKLWKDANDALDERKKRKNRGRPERKPGRYLLNGRLFLAGTDQKMTGVENGGKGRKVSQFYYRCPPAFGVVWKNGNGRKNVLVPAKAIENHVLSVLQNRGLLSAALRRRGDRLKLKDEIAKHVHRIDADSRRFKHRGGNETCEIFGTITLADGETVPFTNADLYQDLKWEKIIRFVQSIWDAERRPVGLAEISKHLRCPRSNGAQRIVWIAEGSGRIAKHSSGRGYVPADHA